MAVFQESSEDAHVLKVLELVRRRPGMYLGPPGVQSLRNFISGLETSRFVQGASPSFLQRDKPDFGAWIAQREKVRYSPSCGWAEAIQAHADTPEQELKAFFSHLDEFVREFGIGSTA